MTNDPLATPRTGGSPGGKVSRPPELLAVVVPAHDEVDLVRNCLRHLRRATTHPDLEGVDVRLLVVADACSDATADVAGIDGATEVTEVSHRNVGAARAAGFRRALAVADGLDLDDVWMATTDADTLVGADWLARQLAWRRAGAEAVAGTVRVDYWRQQGPFARHRFARLQACQGRTDGHGHVHGANLGFSARALVAIGGMPPLAVAEDHALWDRFESVGTTTVAAGDLVVTTSGRREGRAPNGFATLLKELGGGQLTAAETTS